jgi:pSer/pThr/pTyr-binding forkhead associated (FHA) protein
MSVDGGDAASIPPGSPRPQPSGIPTAWGSLHLLESGHVLPLASRPEFTLGRTTEGQPIVPDIDLTPYQAHAQGVSRLHAILRHDGHRILVLDLGSSNGTYVNGRRIPPNLEQLVQNGDVIALGRFKIQLLASNMEKG